MLTCSHTHCGPVVRDNLIDMYEMPPEEPDKIRGLHRQAARLDGRDHRRGGQGPEAGASSRSARARPASRSTAGRATDKGVINGRNPDGPGRSLRAGAPGRGRRRGKLRAVVFGYACHNTTMQFYEWCGDYAGFAQIEVEKKHPGAVALFWTGCGGDANPLPRRKVELCETVRQGTGRRRRGRRSAARRRR